MLEEARGLRLGAGKKIEGGADADEDAGVKLRSELGHEAFLFWGAQADPDEMRLSAGDFGAERGGFGGVERTERRGDCAHDLDTWKSGGEPVAEFLGDARGAAVEEVAEILGAAGVADGEHEVGAVDARNGSALKELAEPHEGHAVGGGEPGGVENAAERGVVVGFAEAVNAGEADVAGRR